MIFIVGHMTTRRHNVASVNDHLIVSNRIEHLRCHWVAFANQFPVSVTVSVIAHLEVCCVC